MPARDAAAEFREAVWGDRYDDLFVIGATGWSAWLHGDGWDHGWLVTDFGTRRAHVICVSSTF